MGREARPRPDAIEEWEFPLPRDLARRSGGEPSVHYLSLTPAASDDSFLASLAQLGITRAGVRLHHVLLIAEMTRSTGPDTSMLACVPSQVLAVVDGLVVLWIDLEGIRTAVPVNAVSAIVDENLGDHRRLTIRAADRRLVVRYRSSGVAQVHDFLTALRRHLHGQDLLGTGTPEKRLAHARWRRVLASVSLPGALCTIATGRNGPGWPHVRRHHLVGVTPHEVLVATAVTPPFGRSHLDVTYLPRNRIRRVRCRGGTLDVEVDDATYTFRMGLPLITEIRTSLSAALPGLDSRTGHKPGAV